MIFQRFSSANPTTMDELIASLTEKTGSIIIRSTHQNTKLEVHAIDDGKRNQSMVERPGGSTR